MLGVLDELIWMIHHASRAGHDHAPALVEGIVNAIDLKTNPAVRLKFCCLLNRRVKDHFAVREPEIHRKCNRSAGCAKHDPPHASGFQVNPTLRRCQCFKNGSAYRTGSTRDPVPVSAQESRGGRPQGAGNCGKCPVPQQHIRVPFEVFEEVRGDASLAGKILNGQTELLAPMGDSSSKISTLRVAGIFHAESVRFT